MLAERKSAANVSYEERLLHDVAKKTEGFAARDLKAIADRAVYGHFINNWQHNPSADTLLVFYLLFKNLMEYALDFYVVINLN